MCVSVCVSVPMLGVFVNQALCAAASPSKATLSPLSLPYVKKLRTNDDKSDHSFGR